VLLGPRQGRSTTRPHMVPNHVTYGIAAFMLAAVDARDEHVVGIPIGGDGMASRGEHPLMAVLQRGR
jgi:hypothetical protein